MTWAAENSSSATVYTMKWTYVQNGKGWGDYTAGRLHAGADIDMHGFTIRNASFPGGGITQTIRYVQVLQMNSNGTVQRWGANGKMVFTNGILTDLTYYT